MHTYGYQTKEEVPLQVNEANKHCSHAIFGKALIFIILILELATQVAAQHFGFMVPFLIYYLVEHKQEALLVCNTFASRMLAISSCFQPASTGSSDLIIHLKVLKTKLEAAVLLANLEPCIKPHLVAAAC